MMAEGTSIQRQAASLIGVCMATFKNIEPYVSARLDLARGQDRGFMCQLLSLDVFCNVLLGGFLQSGRRIAETMMDAVSPGEHAWKTELI